MVALVQQMQLYVSLIQNRRRKVYDRGAALRFCGGALGWCAGLETLKIDKNSTHL